MSGMYGTVKPADIDIDNDVEIMYHYRPSFSSDDTNFNGFKSLPSSVLSLCNSDETSTAISGLFNLKLPLDKFGKKGIYTIYIRPKEIEIKIADVGHLAAFSDIRGVVFNTNDIPNLSTNNALVGYRIEYLNNGKKTGDFKIITSSNLAEPIVYSVGNTYGKNVNYRFVNSGKQIFCTVTPSLAPTFKPTSLPLIGSAGETVKLVNTKFNPVMLEIEMVEHDAETISYMLEGNQLIDKDKALITTFNKKGEIYHQSEFGAYKDDYGNPLYEFKIERENIDFNQKIENLE